MVETLQSLQIYGFYGAIVFFALIELVMPNRAQREPVTRRWSTNIGLFAISIGLNRLLLPISALVVADAAARSGHGLVNLVDGPVWVFALLGLLLLDLWKYWEHRLLHGVGLLWRLHAVHHSDTEADFTTTERHHPLEILLGGVLTGTVIYALGVPPMGVALYLVLAPVVALFSHANIRLHPGLEACLRWVIVTPVFHNVHHSAARPETDSHFGVLLTAWDRLFGTYRRPTPEEDALRMIGLGYFREPRAGWLDRVLRQPFEPSRAYRDPASIETQDETTVVS